MSGSFSSSGACTKGFSKVELAGAPSREREAIASPLSSRDFELDDTDVETSLKDILVLAFHFDNGSVWSFVSVATVTVCVSTPRVDSWNDLFLRCGFCSNTGLLEVTFESPSPSTVDPAFKSIGRAWDPF